MGKFTKKKIFLGGGGGSGGGGAFGLVGWGQGGCEQRIVKIPKKKKLGGGGRVRGGGVRVDVNCERRIKVFVKI